MENSIGFDRITITPHNHQEDGISPYMRVDIQFEETDRIGQELVNVSVLIKGSQKALSDIQIEAISRAQALLQRVVESHRQGTSPSIETWSKLGNLE